VAALDKSRLDETFPGWLRAMTLLVTNYHGQSSFGGGNVLPGDARAGAAVAPPREPDQAGARAPPQEWLNRAFGFSGPGMLSQGHGAARHGAVHDAGHAARIALDGGRTTTLDTVKADPVAVGWYRVTDGDPCAFCALLASRGVVYKEFDTVDLTATQVHNDCGCFGAPAFSRTSSCRR
jgi:hypothetical protein